LLSFAIACKVDCNNSSVWKKRYTILFSFVLLTSHLLARLVKYRELIKWTVVYEPYRAVTSERTSSSGGWLLVAVLIITCNASCNIATNKVCLLCMKMILLLLSSVLFAKGYCKFSPAPKLLAQD
jgi:hypothetical protein